MNGEEMFRQENRLAGDLVEGIYHDFWGKDRHRIGLEEYEVIGSDEAADLLGRGDDDPYLTLLRRKSDGQLFEVEFEVTAWAREAVPPTAEVPGQLALDGAQ